MSRPVIIIRVFSVEENDGNDIHKHKLWPKYFNLNNLYLQIAGEQTNWEWLKEDPRDELVKKPNKLCNDCIKRVIYRETAEMSEISARTWGFALEIRALFSIPESAPGCQVWNCFL